MPSVPHTIVCLKKNTTNQLPIPSQKTLWSWSKIFSVFPKACSKTLLLLLTQETSVMERLVCAHTQSFTLPLPFLVMQWSASHRAQPWFFLFCWPLSCWENTSRALVQAGCVCGTCLMCEKLVCLFLTSDRDGFLPASTFLWGTSHHFHPLQTQRWHDAGSTHETCKSGKTRAGHLTADQRPTLNALSLMSLLYVDWDTSHTYFDCLKKMAQKTNLAKTCRF